MAFPTVPSTNINIYDIDQALGAPSITGQDISLIGLFSYSNVSGLSSPYAGSYHNISMGLGTPARFGTKIYSTYSGGTNLKTSNWASYQHDTNVNLSYTVTNTIAMRGFDVRCDIFLSDTPRANQYLIDTFTVTSGPGGTPTQTKTDWDSGIAAYTSFYGVAGGYFLEANFVLLGGGMPVNMMIVASTDSDGVGQDTGRDNYSTAMGPWDLNSMGPFSDTIVGGAGAWPSLIAWNKRTSFTIIFS
jgi:hypothetical protein